MNSEQSEKYSRQILFPGIGAEGQEKLLTGSAALVGCGALGTVIANLAGACGAGTSANHRPGFRGAIESAAADPV